MQFPYLDITTAQAAGDSPFFAGVIAYWTSEAQTRTESEPAFKMMELKAQELSGYSVSSNIILQDAAFGLEKLLMTLFGKAVAWYGRNDMRNLPASEVFTAFRNAISGVWVVRCQKPPRFSRPCETRSALTGARDTWPDGLELL
jgi:hypothetical protein